MTNWKTLESFETELLEDSAFRKAHEEREADYRIAREILEARLAIGLSQKALAPRRSARLKDAFRNGKARKRSHASAPFAELPTRQVESW